MLISSGAQTALFEDYRPEGAVLEPHRMRINIRSTGELTLLLQRATYNTGLSDSAFDPPRAEAVILPGAQTSCLPAVE